MFDLIIGMSYELHNQDACRCIQQPKPHTDMLKASGRQDIYKNNSAVYWKVFSPISRYQVTDICTLTRLTVDFVLMRGQRCCRPATSSLQANRITAFIVAVRASSSAAACIHSK